MTNDEGRYACKYNGVGLALNCKTSTIDNFDNTKYPIEVRVNGIHVTDPKILNLSQEQRFDPRYTAIVNQLSPDSGTNILDL